MTYISSFLIRRKNIILSIIVSFIIAYSIFYILEEYVGKLDIERHEWDTEFVFSEKINYGSMEIRTKGPDYFHSVGRVHACIFSAYSYYFENLTVSMSLDNYSWVDVPIYPQKPDDLKEYADLGLYNLKNIVITVYCKYHFPPQTVSLPSGLSKNEVSDSFYAHLPIKRESAPGDKVLQFLVLVSLFGTSLRVIDMLFLRKING